jgi:hypothetical protein
MNEQFDKFITSDHDLPMLLAPINAEIVDYSWHAGYESYQQSAEMRALIRAVRHMETHYGSCVQDNPLSLQLFSELFDAAKPFTKEATNDNPR